MSVLDQIFDRVLHLPPVKDRDVRSQKDLDVPMPDGVMLKADRYWQNGRTGDPVVLLRSPYGRASFLRLLGRAFAVRGAQAVIVSCRGTFGSGGEWMPMRDEAPDGLATYEWLARQDWFGDSVVLAGPSYLGYTQWALAAQIPESIAAMVPHVTSSRLTLPFIRPDALDWDLLVRWNFLLENQEDRGTAMRSGLKLDEKRLQRAMSTLPRSAVDVQLAGHRWQFYQDCLAFDSTDDHWVSTDHSAAVKDIGTPASYVGGWYDIFLQDQLRDYRMTLEAAGPQRLTIGPWVHGSPAGMGAAAAETLYFAMPYARGTEPGERAPVRLYVMGTPHKGSAVPGIARQAPAPWRDFDRWPPLGYRPTRLHLTPSGGLSVSAPSDGVPTAPSRFRYDPADPTPSYGGAFLSVGAGPVDNRPLEKRADVLTFTTEQLTDVVEVIGEVYAEIWFGSSLNFTDVFVRLCDVDRKGRSTNICDGIAGITRRRGEHVGQVTISLWPTAYQFQPGHRIRLQISSGSHPRYTRNPGSGEPRATATRLLTADQLVWHDSTYRSAVILPVARSHLGRLS